jgi:hypothetical protein
VATHLPREGASARASVHSCHIALYPRDLRGPEALKVSCHIACPRVCARAWQAALLLEEEDQSRSSQRASTSDKSRIKDKARSRDKPRASGKGFGGGSTRSDGRGEKKSELKDSKSDPKHAKKR